MMPAALDAAEALQTAADLLLSDQIAVKRRFSRSDAILSPRSFLDPQPSFTSDSEATDRSPSLNSMPQASAAPAQERDLVNRCIDASTNVGFGPMPIAEQGPFEARRCSNPFTILQDCELLCIWECKLCPSGILQLECWGRSKWCKLHRTPI